MNEFRPFQDPFDVSVISDCHGFSEVRSKGLNILIFTWRRRLAPNLIGFGDAISEIRYLDVM